MYTVLDLGEAAIHQKRQIEYKAKINMFTVYFQSSMQCPKFTLPASFSMQLVKRIQVYYAL